MIKGLLAALICLFCLATIILIAFCLYHPASMMKIDTLLLKSTGVYLTECN